METMKAVELRYSWANGMFKLVHSSYEHKLGELVLTSLDKEAINMTVIAREESMTDEGFKLISQMYANHKGCIPKRLPNRFDAKIRLILRIMNQIGKLSTIEQKQSYEGYLNKLEYQRNARMSSAMKRMVVFLQTI